MKTFFARTSNRATTSTQAAQPPKPEPQKEACKPKVMKEWRQDEATKRAIDLDCSGRVNALLVLPDDPGQRAYLLWDRNGDGKADVKYYLNRAKEPEYSEWDDHFDGTYDYRAEYENGDWDPKAKIRIASR